MTQTTAQAARGKWKTILARFGIDELYLNGKHHPCPCTGDGVDRFRFTDKDQAGRYFCQCSDGSEGGIGLVMCKTGLNFREAAAEIDKITGRNPQFDEEPKVYYSHTLKRYARSAPRSRYLESRGLEMAPGLMWADSVDYRTGEEDGGQCLSLPAMLAPITRDGQFHTFHVTYLQNGAKASVPVPRKILPGPEWSGGACELYPAGPILGIAEGIETAIAAKMLHRHPVWAGLNTSGMKNWKPPQCVEEVVIYADNDANYAGHAAAYALAHKLHGKVKVQVMIPPNVGEDWNDVLNRIQRNGGGL